MSNNQFAASSHADLKEVSEDTAKAIIANASTIKIQLRDSTMRQVNFSEVPRGEFFKEDPNGPWMLKNSSSTGVWKADGVESCPSFNSTEKVWVEV